MITRSEAVDIVGEEHADTLMGICERGHEHGLAGWYHDGDYSSDADWRNGVGATINRLEEQLEIGDGTIFDCYTEAHDEGLTDRVADKRALRIVAENTDDDAFTVVLTCGDGTSMGPDWCDHHGSLGGSTWEDAGDGLMYDMISWTPTLADELSEYDIDWSNWSDPDEEDYAVVEHMRTCVLCESTDFHNARDHYQAKRPESIETISDYRAVINWERWEAKRTRAEGNTYLALGHELAAKRYQDEMWEKHRCR